MLKDESLTNSKKIHKELISLSLPVLISSLANTIIAIAAIPILGNYSVEAMAASASYASITMIFSNLLLASLAGYRILGSKALGAKNYNSASDLFSNSIFLALVISLVLACILFFCSGQIASLMSRENDIQNLTTSFLKIGTLTYPLMAITNAILISFSLQKHTKLPMYLSIIGDIIGITLSIFLVYGISGFPKLGPIGVVWGNVIQSVTICIASIILFNSHINKVRFKIKMEISKIKSLFSLSYPMMISMFVDYLASFVMFAMIGYYLGKESLAAGRLGFTLSLLFFSIIASMSSGFMIMGGRALGQKNYKGFILYHLSNRKILMNIAFVLAAFLLISPDYILKFFTSFKEVRNIAFTPLVIVAISTFFMGWSFSNACYLRLTEKVKTDMLCNIASLWIVQIPMSYYLGVYMNLNLVGFFIAFLLYDITYSLSTHYFVKNSVPA